MSETKNCITCGGKAYHNQGISKAKGLPWENWKCGQGHTEWVDLKQPQEVRVASEPRPDWDKIQAAKEESMAYLNAKNNATLLLVEAMRGGLSLKEALENFDSVAQKIYEVGENK